MKAKGLAKRIAAIVIGATIGIGAAAAAQQVTSMQAGLSSSPGRMQAGVITSPGPRFMAGILTSPGPRANTRKAGCGRGCPEYLAIPGIRGTGGGA
jgi:hypothetical protein